MSDVIPFRGQRPSQSNLRVPRQPLPIELVGALIGGAPSPPIAVEIGCRSRSAIEAAIGQLIDALDDIDGDADAEAESDAEHDGCERFGDRIRGGGDE